MHLIRFYVDIIRKLFQFNCCYFFKFLLLKICMPYKLSRNYDYNLIIYSYLVYFGIYCMILFPFKIEKYYPRNLTFFNINIKFVFYKLYKIKFREKTLIKIKIIYACLKKYDIYIKNIINYYLNKF